MADFRYPEPEGEIPLVLLVPGRPLEAGHWMNRWASWSEHCRTIELGLWDEPHRNTWVNKLNLAIRRAERPVVVVTEDIAALALAWWVEFESIGADNPVLGALVVNPPNVDLSGSDRRLARFGACPRRMLPFPSFMVADPKAPLTHQRALARLAADWGASLVTDDTRGNWPQGWGLLHTVLGEEAANVIAPHWSRDEHIAIREALREWAGF